MTCPYVALRKWEDKGMITEHDTSSRRCPRLGHEVTFSYCRQPGDEIPCSKIYDCWFESFDIKLFMEKHYSENILSHINEKPKPKVLSLLEMIQEAQKRNKK